MGFGVGKELKDFGVGRTCFPSNSQGRTRKCGEQVEQAHNGVKATYAQKTRSFCINHSLMQIRKFVVLSFQKFS